MEIPSDYVWGYEKARALDPEAAANYVAHTTIGDPVADAAVEELAALDRAEATLFVSALMDQEDEEAFQDAPPALRAFFDELASPPGWFDPHAATPGIRMFYRNSKLVLGAFVGGTLIEGFSTNISKSFFITGRVRDQGVRRLHQNNRHMIELFVPGGLGRDGDGWKLSVRVRLVHAQVRHLLNQSEDWDRETWGEPISAAHVGFAITAFSARLLAHLESLGAVFDDEERESFMAVWRYSGHLMGIPETILFKTEEEALRIFETGSLCEPPPGHEAASMAHSLVNSAPLVIGIDDPGERRKLSRYVFSISRALIGNDLADALRYPPSSTFGVLGWFRMQARYEHLLERLIPGKMRSHNFSNFTALMDASGLDEVGISYRMPDHVYAEESSRW